jgi:hypothetical protein
MDIEYRQSGKKWIADVWSDYSTEGISEMLDEEYYAEINQWCIDTLGYHARTAYPVFEFRKRQDLEFFILRWA